MRGSCVTIYSSRLHAILLDQAKKMLLRAKRRCPAVDNSACSLLVFSQIPCRSACIQAKREHDRVGMQSPGLAAQRLQLLGVHACHHVGGPTADLPSGGRRPIWGDRGKKRPAS
jgi:hypothetical protein